MAANIYVWGSNSSYQCGDTKKKSIEHPTPINSLTGVNIIAASCGEAHTVALSEGGDVYSWGLSSYGRLGYKRQGNQATPRIIDNLFAIVQIACGESHTLALTACGDVFSWGQNSYGQLGVSSMKCEYRDKPAKVKGLPHDVVKIAVGRWHNVSLMRDGRVFMWGRGSDHQLGQFPNPDETDEDNVYQPFPMQRVDEMTMSGRDPLVDVSCGGYHTMFRTASGKAYSIGVYDWSLANGTHGSFHSVATGCTTPRLLKDVVETDSPNAVGGKDRTSYIGSTLDYGVFIAGGHVHTVGNASSLSASSWRPRQHEMKTSGKPKQIVGGINSTIVLDERGTLWSARSKEVQVMNFSQNENFVGIAGNYFHFVAIKEGQSRLSTDILNLLQDPTRDRTADFALVAEGEAPKSGEGTSEVSKGEFIPCHRSVLFARCPKLRSKASGVDVYKIEKHSATALNIALKLIYGDDIQDDVVEMVKVQRHLLDEVAELLNEWELPSLEVKWCHKFSTMEFEDEVVRVETKSERGPAMNKNPLAPILQKQQPRLATQEQLASIQRNPPASSSKAKEMAPPPLPPHPRKYRLQQRLTKLKTKGIDRHRNLKTDLSSLMEDKSGYDAIVVVDGKRWKVHKAILASRSPFFRGLWFSGMAEENHREIDLDVCPDVFPCILEYIYTGLVNVAEYDMRNWHPLTLMELVFTADYLGIADMCPSVENMIMSFVNKDNVVELLITSDALPCRHQIGDQFRNSVKDHCLAFMVKHDMKIKGKRDDVPPHLLDPLTEELKDPRFKFMELGATFSDEEESNDAGGSSSDSAQNEPTNIIIPAERRRKKGFFKFFRKFCVG